MTPFSSFNDHPVEFIFMEVIGTFMIPVALNPLPLPILCLVWSWQCFSGILDHSNAKEEGNYFLDAEYHMTHHQLTVYNYAEFEILDKIAGTLYTGDTKWRNQMSTFEKIDADVLAGKWPITEESAKKTTE
jgi:sterol desaturase/sphingolipid hydroxylase (fatty acid hydroxylase superfamily)